MIPTIHGDMDEAALVKTAGVEETARESVAWVEYRLPDHAEIVHRSVHVTLKQCVSLGAETGGF